MDTSTPKLETRLVEIVLPIYTTENAVSLEDADTEREVGKLIRYIRSRGRSGVPLQRLCAAMIETTARLCGSARLLRSAAEGTLGQPASDPDTVEKAEAIGKALAGRIVQFGGGLAPGEYDA